MEKFSENIIGDIKDEITFLTEELQKTFTTLQTPANTLEKIDQFIEEVYILIITKVTEKLTQVSYS